MELLRNMNIRYGAVREPHKSSNKPATIRPQPEAAESRIPDRIDFRSGGAIGACGVGNGGDGLWAAAVIMDTLDKASVGCAAWRGGREAAGIAVVAVRSRAPTPASTAVAILWSVILLT